jgi:hypothetical protein
MCDHIGDHMCDHIGDHTGDRVGVPVSARKIATWR